MVWLQTLQYWLYRASGHAALHFMDDPAWLALIFC
jgi:hypothetical protein